MSASWPSPRRIFAVLTRCGLVRSDDGGRSWTSLYPRVTGRRAHLALTPGGALGAVTTRISESAD